MTDAPEITWPSDDAFEVLSGGRKPAKVKEPAPPVTCGVRSLGVYVSLAPEIVQALGWTHGPGRLRVDGHARDGIVYLRCNEDPAGNVPLKGPVAPRRDGTPGRSAIQLGHRGRFGFVQRNTSAIVFEQREGVLLLQIPIEAPEGAEPDEDEGADQPADPSGSTGAGHAQSVINSGGSEEDFERACDAAQLAAICAWPKQVDEENPPAPVRIAAAVALVEAGWNSTRVRQALDLENMLLPLREEMPHPGLKAATAALAALRGEDD